MEMYIQYTTPQAEHRLKRVPETSPMFVVGICVAPHDAQCFIVDML